MTTSSESSQSENTYILGHTAAEKARLIEQDHHFTQAMGGLLPEQSNLSTIHRVLDVACGPGGWALELAQAYPHMEVVGFDIDAGMIDYANAQAHASGLDNVSFRVGNVMKPFDFPSDYFDLVNTRFTEGVIPITVWPVLVQEMVRTTRRGGIIRLTDCEWGVSNSAAFEKSLEMAIGAMQVSGLSHSPDGRNYTITPWLSRFLRDAGCVNIQERPSFMDISTETKTEGWSFPDYYIVGYQLMQPFLVGTKVATQQEVEQLHHRLLIEMLADEFCGMIHILTAWGEKP